MSLTNSSIEVRKQVFRPFFINRETITFIIKFQPNPLMYLCSSSTITSLGTPFARASPSTRSSTDPSPGAESASSRPMPPSTRRSRPTTCRTRWTSTRSSKVGNNYQIRISLVLQFIKKLHPFSIELFLYSVNCQIHTAKHNTRLSHKLIPVQT